MNLYSLRYANGKELCVKYKKSVYQSLVLITQFGINMIVPIFLCTGLGIFIDKKSGLGFFIIPLFILGALAGFRNCFIARDFGLALRWQWEWRSILLL